MSPFKARGRIRKIGFGLLFSRNEIHSVETYDRKTEEFMGYKDLIFHSQIKDFFTIYKIEEIDHPR